MESVSLEPLMGVLAENQDLVATCCHGPVWPPAGQNANFIFVLPPFSSCGEDMEASDGEGEEEVLPPSKVTPCSHSCYFTQVIVLESTCCGALCRV